MIIDSALKGDIESAYMTSREKAVNPAFRQFFTVVGTNSDSKQIKFFGRRGKLRRMQGERQGNDRGPVYKMFASLDDWELTKVYSQNDLDDDPTGQFMLTDASGFANQVEKDLSSETMYALRQGTSRLSFDRVPFYSFSHAYVDEKGVTRGGTTYSNLNLAALGVSTSTVQVAGEYFANIKDDQGQPDPGKMTHAVARRGSTNAIALREIAKSVTTVESSKGQGTINAWQGSFEVIEVDEGLGMDEWAAFDLSDDTNKPLIVLSHRKSPGIDNLEFSILGDGSDEKFWRRKVGMGVFGRFDWNPGDWRTAYLFGSSAYTFPAVDLTSQKNIDLNDY